MEEQTLYDELVNGLREIEKNVITDLNAGQASGSWMGRIVSNEAPANYLNVQITEIQRTGMISVQADTVVKNKIVGIQKIEIGKEDVMKNGVTSFENKDFLDHLKSNSRSLETVSESITDKGDQRFMVFQTGQKENSLREHYKWLKSNGYNEFPEEDGKASAPAAAPTKKINREIKFNVPKGLTKAEFENTIKFFKENGAKYHVDEKIWTIKESQREKFAQYLNPENMHAAPKNEPQSSEERVRLNIPRYLKPDEFKNLIQYFKKNGAKYEPEEKAWFVEKSKIEVFEKYIKKEISGQILAETQDHLILEGKDGKEISVAKKEIYDEMQTSIVEKAMSMDQNVRDQIDLIGNPKLSAPQMDQILNGINDGLQPLLVAQYANPKIPAWQMDIYRYGMLNGLGYDQIKVGCLQDWDSSRNNIDNMIKEQRGHIVSDLKANNYIPEKRLVHKIGRLNGLTGGKFNKVSDIVNSVKSGKISNRYGEASLLKEIGDDLQHQRKIMSPAAQQKIHAAAAVPTR